MSEVVFYETSVSAQIVGFNHLTQPPIPEVTPEEISISSIASLRSSIYAFGKFIAEENGVVTKAFKYTFAGISEIPFTAIDIMMSVNEEGIVQATVTATLAATGAITFTAVALALLPETAASVVAAALVAGAVNYGLSKLLDGIYDSIENQIGIAKYNNSSDTTLIETNLENIDDVKNLVEGYTNVQSSKNITIAQTVNNETTIYTIKKGDTVWDLCQRYGISEEELIKANPWLDERYSADRKFALIRPDEQLIISEGSIKGTDNTQINQDFNNFLNGNYSNVDTSAPAGVTLPASGKTENPTIEHYTSKPQMLSPDAILQRALKEGNIEALQKVIPNADRKMLDALRLLATLPGNPLQNANFNKILCYRNSSICKT